MTGLTIALLIAALLGSAGCSTNTFPPRGNVRDTPADTTKADRLEPILADLLTHT